MSRDSTDELLNTLADAIVLVLQSQPTLQNHVACEEWGGCRYGS